MYGSSLRDVLPVSKGDVKYSDVCGKMDTFYWRYFLVCVVAFPDGGDGDRNVIYV